jgi:hypothetical protein
MAQTIVVDGVYFTLNGQQYTRNYIPLRAGASNIAIYNLFDNRLQLLPSTPYTEFTVDGGGFASQELAMVGLNAALYANPADGLIGYEGGLVASRISNFAQVGTFGTAYVKIGAIGIPNALTLDGQVLQVKYSGTVDRVSGTPLITLQGYSTNLIIGQVTAPPASNKPWEISTEVMRVSSSIAQFTSTFKVNGQETQILTGEKTGLDFTAAHSMSLVWQDQQTGDDFLMRFGYVNKLT